jgi:hypothetical protein
MTTEQNFCSRCGKRTKDIHTCTPPQRTEPVAKYSDIVSDGGLDPRNKFDTPPQRTWVELTDEEINNAIKEKNIAPLFTYRMIARTIEAKLKEKNNG